jgi:hypothetical protein
MTIFHKITKLAKLVILLIIPTYAKVSNDFCFFDYGRVYPNSSDYQTLSGAGVSIEIKNKDIVVKLTAAKNLKKPNSINIFHQLDNFMKHSHTLCYDYIS